MNKEASHIEFKPGNVQGSVLAMVTSMSHSGGFPDGMPILGIAVHTKSGEIIKGEFQAGRDTSEWSFDNAEVQATIQHKRARIAEVMGCTDIPGA